MARIIAMEEEKQLGNMTVDGNDLRERGFVLEVPKIRSDRVGCISNQYLKVKDNDGRYFGQAFPRPDGKSYRLNVRAPIDKVKQFDGFRKTGIIVKGRMTGIPSLPEAYLKYKGNVSYDNEYGSEMGTFREEGLTVQVFGKPVSDEERTFIAYVKGDDPIESVRKFFDRLH